MKRVLIALFVVFVIFPAVYGLIYYLRIDWTGRPFCHKQIWFASEDWQQANKTGDFPNVDGRSQKSMAALEQVWSYLDWTNDYRYVPGLKQGDPGELVLLYLKQPTRWRWHGQLPPTVSGEEAWLILPVDFSWGERIPEYPVTEVTERVPTSEFKRRLEATLEYLRENERENWETVVAEHTEFLESINELE